jgi:hypothetical protein
VHDTKSLGWVIALGVTIGIAVTMKQTAIPNAMWLVGALPFVARGRERWRWPLIAAMSAACALFVVVLPYLLAGAGGDLLDGMLWHNLEYVAAKLEPQRLHITLFQIGLWLGALFGVFVLARGRNWWMLGVLGGWAVSSWIGVSAGAVYRGHYFLQLLPPICILFALALDKTRRPIQIVIVPVIIASWVLSNGWQWSATQARLSDQRYRSLFFQNAELAGKWLRRQDDRSLYVLGSDPEIYFYADAQATTRYTIQNPLFGGFASSPRRQRETWMDIQRSRPRWIVTVFPPYAIPFFRGSDPWLIEQVDTLLAAHYKPRMAAVHGSIRLDSIAAVPNPSARDLTIWERVN